MATEQMTVIMEDPLSLDDSSEEDIKNEKSDKSDPIKTSSDFSTESEKSDKLSKELESKIVFNEEIENIKKELDQLSPLHLPCRYFDFPEEFEITDADESYATLSKSEIVCLDYIDNFIRQYKEIYKDRKALLLIPCNEYNVRKYICTYIRPTKFKQSDFWHWSTTAKFVSDYLDFVPVVPSTEVPNRILSSSMVLQIRKGTCFEFSNLLCSLLLGVGYNAFVVSGYATRECCYIDQSRSPCPFLDDKPKITETKKTDQIQKYVVRPPKDLKSKFELYEEARKIEQEAVEKERILLEEEEEIKIREKPPPDPLVGLRVHCWILIKAESRDIGEDFFIEPLTGRLVPLKTNMYLGIESVWNNTNCWINMQDCSKGINYMEFNLDDRFKWELVLPVQPMVPQSELSENQNEWNRMNSENYLEDEVEIVPLIKVIETPRSWIKKLTLSLVDYEKKFINNQKKTIYYKTKCIRYSPYSNPDGLIMKLFLYKDMTLKELIEERKYYENRMDKLYLIIQRDGWTIEHFTEGYYCNLKEHHYRTNHLQPETERIFIFYHINNVDGLEIKKETSSTLEEYYVNRQDRLIYMCCTFTKRHFEISNKNLPYRNIEKIVKRFSRNPDLPCNEDIAEMILYLLEDRVFITYHRDKYNLIPDTREYFKPPISQDGKNTIPFYNDTHYHFRANPGCRPEDTKLKVYQYLLSLFAIEKKEKDLVRWSENQTKNILNQRNTDIEQTNLFITLFDTIRNTVASKRRIELEAIDEMEKRKGEDELDYLAPFLYNQNINEIESKEDAFKIREECLMDFKLSLIYKANIIQSRYDEETAKLQSKQQWYYQNQGEMLKEDEDEYLDFCTKAAFTINNLETMLNRHKHMAPRKYIDLERKLRNDIRLKKFLNAL